MLQALSITQHLSQQKEFTIFVMKTKLYLKRIEQRQTKNILVINVLHVLLRKFRLHDQLLLFEQRIARFKQSLNCLLFTTK